MNNYPLPGMMIKNRYTINDLIDQGGTAYVLKVWDMQLNKTMVLKGFFKEKLTSELKKRVFAEPHLRLCSPHINKATDAFEEKGVLYSVQPFIKGETLHTRLLRENTLPEIEAYRIIQGILNACKELHANNVLMADLKSDNIMISSSDESVIVIDLGCHEYIGKTPKVSKGTNNYADPSLRAKNILTPKIDLYGVGIILYEIIIGAKSFNEENIPQIDSIKYSHPDIYKIICKATKEPNRYETAQEMLQEINILSRNNLANINYSYLSGRDLLFRTLLGNTDISLHLQNGKTLLIGHGESIIGRSNIDSSNYCISRQQFKINNNSVTKIMNLGAKNPTKLNGKTINSYDWFSLNNTDIIQVANVSMTVQL